MFKLDPELEDFRSEARKLAEREFAPKAAYWDDKEEFPAANRDKLAELGYLGMFIPEEYGGSGAPVVQGTVFLEEMARVCFNTALVSQLYLNGPSRAISILGNDEQKERFLPDMAAGRKFIAIAISEPEAGSAVTDLRTTATKDGDGWVLNGNKCWSTGAHVADYALVFCRFGKARLQTSVTGPRPSSDFAEQNQSRWRVPLMRSFRLPQRGSCSRSLGNVLRFVVSQAGCRQDAGSMQFRRVHLISVLSLAGDGPEPDIIGTASLRDLGSLRSDRRSGLDQAAASILKFVPSTHMRCSTTAMRRARATIARFRPRRFAT